MTKRFCDRCGKEVGVFKDLEFQTWWTITRHGMMDLTTELCDDCYQAKFEADTTQTESQIITCYGTCTDKCGAYEKGDCILNAKQVDTPQADLLVKTPRKSRESHEKNCETCRDKDAYDEWQGNCDECENGSMYTPQTDCGWK